jgi:hypothetical protein
VKQITKAKLKKKPLHNFLPILSIKSSECESSSKETLGDIFQPKGFQNQILKVEKQWPLLIAPKQTHKNKQTNKQNILNCIHSNVMRTLVPSTKNDSKIFC